MRIIKQYKRDRYGSFQIFKRKDCIKSCDVSVIMSVYNGDIYLIKSIESVLNQTFKKCEFIIINDGSTDKSIEIINEFLKKDKRIIVISQNNMGLTRSLNRGLLQSRGVFIARQDADDISLKDRFKRQINFFKNNPEYGLIGSRYKIITEDNRILDQKDKFFFKKDMDLRKKIVRLNPFCHQSVMFKKEILNTVGMYNIKYKYAQDYELWFRIMQKYKAANLPDVLVYRRYLESMITQKYLKKQIYYMICIQFYILFHSEFLFKSIYYILRNIIKFFIPVRFIKKASLY